MPKTTFNASKQCVKMGGLASINIRFNVGLTELSTDLQNAGRELEKVGKKMQDIGENLSAYVSVPIVAAGGFAIKFASDFNESLNKVDVAFKSSAAGVKDFASETLDNFGIAEGSALDMAALFGDMATSMGLPVGAAEKMSTSLVGLAGDLASFKNIGIDQATTALNGIFTGETESLKRIGVVMTEANLQSFAFTQGIKTQIKDMTQAEKVNLRFAYVMQQTKNAQGDFAKTSGGAANQTRVFQESIKQIGAQIGQILLPLYTRVVKSINEAVKSFSKLSDGTKTTIVVIAGLAAATGPLIFAIGTVTKLLPVMASGYLTVTKYIGLNAIATAAAAIQTKAIAIANGIATIATEAFAAAQMLLTKNVIGANQALRVIQATVTSTPWGLLAVAVAAAAAAFFVYYQNSDKVSKSNIELTASQKLMQKVTDEASGSIVDQKSKLETLLLTARNENEEKQVRLRAISEINKISPEYLGNLTLENINTDKARVAIEKYNAALLSGALARAAQRGLDNAAADKIKAGFEREKALAEYNAKRTEAIGKGWEEEKKFYEENNRLLGFANDALDRANAKYDFESKILLDIINKNKDNLKLVQETTAALEALGPKPGTIEYYEQQISGLKKIQTEVVTTYTAWKAYEDRIDAIQKKIDAIQGKGPIKLPEPELPSLGETEAPATVVFSLEDLKGQKSYFEQLREQFSTTSDEYAALTEQINNTDFKIGQIEIDPAGLELTKENIKGTVDFLAAEGARADAINKTISESMASTFDTMANGLVDSMGLAETGFQGFVKGILQTVIKLISMMLAQSMATAIAGATETGTATGPAAVFTTPAFIATAIAGVLSAFASIPKFESGGIFGGTSYYGDKILARVNSSELVLNNKQQKAAFSLMESASNAVNVMVGGSFEIQGTMLRLVLDRTDQQQNRIK